MRIAICEDELEQCSYLENILIGLNKELDMKAEIECFLTGEKLIQYMKEENNIDVYLLDIEIGTMNGVEIAKIIRKNDIKAVIVFITSHKGYMPEAFEVHAYNYISKPFHKEQIYELMDSILKYINITKQKLFFEYNREKYSINFQDIIYLESNKRLIEVTSVEGSYEFYGKLKELANKLPIRNFSFIRSGCIINMSYIKKIEKNRVYYTVPGNKNPLYLEISRNYFNIFIVNYRDFVKSM